MAHRPFSRFRVAFLAVAALSVGACGGAVDVTTGGNEIDEIGRSGYDAGSPRVARPAEADSGPTGTQFAVRGAPGRTQVARSAPPARATTPSGESSGLFGGFLNRTDPDDLIGQAPTKITATLGRPSLVRREAPAEVWQYRTRSCVLDLFLSDQGDGQGPLVRHVEGRDRAGAPASASDCIETVQDEL